MPRSVRRRHPPGARCPGGALLLLGLLSGAHAATAVPARSNDNISAYLSGDFTFVEAPQVEAYLKTVITRLLESSTVTLAIPSILVLSSEEYNCFTDARGNLVVTTEALREFSSEDELAAVLGHELSHLIHRDPQRKNVLRSFPIGLETATTLAAAVDRLNHQDSSAYDGRLARHNEDALPRTQVVSLLWSDIMAPGWNRKQERAADERGFELTRTAGYDPSAYARVFQRLGTLAAQRSQRLEMLRKVMLQRAQQQAARARDAHHGDLVGELRGRMTERAVESVTETLTRFNREYDSPEERQRNLSGYAAAHRYKGKPRAHPPSGLGVALRQGRGAHLLSLDASALAAIKAMYARQRSAAQSAVAPLQAAAVGGTPPTPHLNLALGMWYQWNGQTAQAEQRARAWAASLRPPAAAYLWTASYTFQRKEYRSSIRTLDRGRERVGNGAPFLPDLVTLARLAGDEPAANQYALECRAEELRNAAPAVLQFFQGNRVPAGLYADCVQRLGHEPTPVSLGGRVLDTARHPVTAGKKAGQKLRDIFKRGDENTPAAK